MGAIVFNGISSEDYRIQVEHPPGYETPERDYEIIHVPGRNGDIVLDKGSYKNVSRKYEIAVASHHREFTSQANDISKWLHSASGYARLEDSYEPDYYRLAFYEEATDIANIIQYAGRATVSFNCKPQRFLKVGDISIFPKSGEIIRNPTVFASLPIIIVRGSGSGVMKIGGYTATISSISSPLTINSEIQDIYSGVLNKNATVTLSSGFPKLTPGNNDISYSGGISSLEVIPKWWTL